MWQEKDKFNGYIKGLWDYEGEDIEESTEDNSDLASAILERVEDTYVHRITG
jgi:hypothetical protein